MAEADDIEEDEDIDRDSDVEISNTIHISQSMISIVTSSFTFNNILNGNIEGWQAGVHNATGKNNTVKSSYKHTGGTDQCMLIPGVVCIMQYIRTVLLRRALSSRQSENKKAST